MGLDNIIIGHLGTVIGCEKRAQSGSDVATNVANIRKDEVEKLIYSFRKSISGE